MFIINRKVSDAAGNIRIEAHVYMVNVISPCASTWVKYRDTRLQHRSKRVVEWVWDGDNPSGRAAMVVGMSTWKTTENYNAKCYSKVGFGETHPLSQKMIVRLVMSLISQPIMEGVRGRSLQSPRSHSCQWHAE